MAFSNELNEFGGRSLWRAFWGGAGVLGLWFGAGCGGHPTWGGPQYGATPVAPRAAQVYHFAVHPLSNPQKLAKDFQPLIDHFNRQLPGLRFELESSRDYGTFEEKYRSREPQFIQPNPWQALDAIKAGYVVLAMAGDPDDFRGLVLVRKDSGIRTVPDLKGRAVAYPAPTALAACMMPQLYFLDHGLDPMKELDNRFVGTQESAILNVLTGQVAAGCTWPPPWRAFQKAYPLQAAELRVAWQTEPLANIAFMARNDVPKAVQEQVRGLVVKLKLSPEGRQILDNMGTAGYAPATAADYDGVRRFVAAFERRVRPAQVR